MTANAWGAGGKPTINDVARLAGVSKKTVSRVVNRSPLLTDETRARVDEVIRRTGYIPNPQARALALRRNFLIGLIHDNPNAQMVMNVEHGLLGVLGPTEYELIVHRVDRGDPTMTDDIRAFLKRQRPHGVVLLPPISEDDALARLCDELGCRYVRMGSAELDTPERTVASNDRVVVREAVGFLIEQGHRRIGMVAGPRGFRSADERRAGFVEALAAAGLAPDPALIVEGDYQFESGRAAGTRLFAAPERPTAIFSSNDEMAAGIVHAARARGLEVPRDISLIGFDDTPIAAHVWPPLSTVHWPIEQMARAAAQKLLAGTAEAVDGEPAPALVVSRLIHRSSVAPPA